MPSGTPVPASKPFEELAASLGHSSRAKSIQNAVRDYLVTHDMYTVLKANNLPPDVAEQLLDSPLVQALYSKRLEHLRAVGRTLTGPVLLGLLILDPRKYYQVAQGASPEPELAALGKLIEQALANRPEGQEQAE